MKEKGKKVKRERAKELYLEEVRQKKVLQWN